jgi:hypothetical protein
VTVPTVPVPQHCTTDGQIRRCAIRVSRPGWSGSWCCRPAPPPSEGRALPDVSPRKNPTESKKYLRIQNLKKKVSFQLTGTNPDSTDEVAYYYIVVVHRYSSGGEK